MKKNITALLLLATFFLTACANAEAPSAASSSGQSATGEEEKMKVAAAFYPLAEFARQTGKDRVEVFTVTPPGAEPHEYEPTPKDISEINQSGLLILNGGGQDEWGERIKDELKQKGIQVITMTDSLNTMNDPHIWLDPVLAVQEVDAIRDALVQIDPTSAAVFKKSSEQYKKELASLDEQYQAGLKTCKRRDFVTSHSAFGYLAKRYDLNQIAISGLSTEEEPSAKRIAEIADMAQENGIKYIFFETLVSPKLSETIATEIGAQTLVLNPIEGLTQDDMAAGKNYVTLMQENLKNLRTALECE